MKKPFANKGGGGAAAGSFYGGSFSNGSFSGRTLGGKHPSMFSLMSNRSLRLERWGDWIAYHDHDARSAASSTKSAAEVEAEAEAAKLSALDKPPSKAGPDAGKTGKNIPSPKAGASSGGTFWYNH